MKLNEYQDMAAVTRPSVTNAEHIVNCALGITGEAGEVADHIKKWKYHGHEVNDEHIKKELGDILWYVSEMASCFGYTLDEIATTNIMKLRKRYPNGFSEYDSINREE